MFFLGLSVYLLVCPLTNAELWCFKCDDTFHPAICQEVTVCSESESCYTDVHASNTGASVYGSGCKATADCTTFAKRASTTQCVECCNSTLCNEDLCQAESIKTPNRLWCATCQFQVDPSDCDTIDLCSEDELCAVSQNDRFGRTFYNMECQTRSQCQNKTLAADKYQCCDSDLCNSNTVGVSPDILTTTPLPTTQPPPTPAVASLANDSVVFVSQHQPNETLVLVCGIEGFPSPNVTWVFTPSDTSGGDGNDTSGDSSSGNSTESSSSMEITTGVTTSDNTSTLVIDSPDASDSGQYTCRAENSMGISDDNVTVDILAAPVIIGPKNETIQCNAREDVLLDCEVEGTPTPTIDWIYPPTAGGVEKLDNGSLLLHNAHTDNTGTYLCLAANSVGGVAKKIDVEVTDTDSSGCGEAATPTSPSVSPLQPPPISRRRVIRDSNLKKRSIGVGTNILKGQPAAAGQTWFDLELGAALLHCIVPSHSKSRFHGITWSRLELDFDHKDTLAYMDSGLGALAIISPTHSVAHTGVYECHVTGRNPERRALFVVYTWAASRGNISCKQVFSTGQLPTGSVLRTRCGECPVRTKAVNARRELKQNDRICESAIKRGVISPSGGTVTWLIKNDNKVALIFDDNGYVKLIP